MWSSAKTTILLEWNDCQYYMSDSSRMSGTNLRLIGFPEVSEFILHRCYTMNTATTSSIRSALAGSKNRVVRLWLSNYTIGSCAMATYLSVKASLIWIILCFMFLRAFSHNYHRCTRRALVMSTTPSRRILYLFNAFPTMPFYFSLLWYWYILTHDAWIVSVFKDGKCLHSSFKEAIYLFWSPCKLWSSEGL